MSVAIFTVGILRDFVAQHFLFGGDWGRENQPHSHHYRLEAIFEGERLDRHGYLLDIAEVEPCLDALVERYRDHMLNELQDSLPRAGHPRQKGHRRLRPGSGRHHRHALHHLPPRGDGSLSAGRQAPRRSAC